MEPNQTTMMGPNRLPTRAVPCRWIENSSTMTTSVVGTIDLPMSGLISRMPSMALSTDMAGVISVSQ